MKSLYLMDPENKVNKKKSPKILIINVHSIQNAGDAALLKTAIHLLKEFFEQPEFIISTNNPSEFSTDTPVEARVIAAPGNIIARGNAPETLQALRLAAGIFLCLLYQIPFLARRKIFPSSRWFELIESYRSADFVVGCPGNQFFSMGRFGWPLIVSGISVWVGLLLKKPFYVLPQSLGPFHRKWEERFVAFLYRKARLIFVRDAYSYRVARNWEGAENKTFYAPDLAFDLPPIQRGEAEKILCRWGYKPSMPSIGVTVISRMVKTLAEEDVKKYYTDLACGLAKFADSHDMLVYLFSQVTGPSANEDDRNAIQKLLASVPPKDHHRFIIIDEVLSAEALKGCYGCMDLFVASRLHSGIFAINMLVPTLFIGYLTKTQGMVESLGLQDWFIQMESITEDGLLERLEALRDKKDEVRNSLKQTMEKTRQETRQLGFTIVQDYYGTR